MTEAAERGATVVADRVVRRIAEQAVSETVLPRGRAKAARGTAAVRGRRADVEVGVRLPYPAALDESGSGVRDTVTARVAYLTGLTVTRTTVQIRELAAGPDPDCPAGAPPDTDSGPAVDTPAGAPPDTDSGPDTRPAADARTDRDSGADEAAGTRPGSGQATDEPRSDGAAEHPHSRPGPGQHAGESRSVGADGRASTRAGRHLGKTRDSGTGRLPGGRSGAGANRNLRDGGHMRARHGPGPDADTDRDVANGGLAGARRRPWAQRRLAAGAAGLVVAAGAAALLCDLVSVHATGRPPARWRMRLLGWLASHGPGDLPVVVGGAVVAVLGAWLLVLALTPGLRGLLVMSAPPGHHLERAVLERSAAARLLTDAGLDVPGVTSMRVRVGRRRVRVRARLGFGDRTASRARLAAAAESALAGMGLAREPRLRVRLRTEAHWRPPGPVPAEEPRTKEPAGEPAA